MKLSSTTREYKKLYVCILIEEKKRIELNNVIIEIFVLRGRTFIRHRYQSLRS